MKKVLIPKLLGLCLLLSFFSLYAIYSFGILPNKYLMFITALILLLNILIIFLCTKRRKRGKKINIYRLIGIILLVLLSTLNTLIIYYVGSTNKFLNNSFSGKVVEKTTYYIISNKENKYTVDDIKGEVIHFKNIKEESKIASRVTGDYEVKLKKYDILNEMFNDILNNKEKFALVESTSYNVLKSFNKQVEENISVVTEINIREEKESSSNIKKSFNIYIVGTDFAGLNDFNMLVTVNTKTKKILLTSIPRDYHIDVYGMEGMKDNITYMSALGVETSIKSLEKFLDTTIDYYVKVNTSSLVKLVDEVGGITFCSDYEYTTTHALVIDTYNDYGEKLYIKKGCQELNGIETLTVARERIKIPGSDVARQENCRKIMIAIINKLKSVDTITNYNELLVAIQDLYETTIPKEVIESLGKDALSSGSKYKILEQSLTGEDVKGYVHLGSVYDYTMTPDPNSVENGKKGIKTLLNEKK